MTRSFPKIKCPMTVLAAVGLSLCMLLSVATAFSGCGPVGVYTTTFLDTFDTVLTVTVGASTREQATEWTVALHGIARDLHSQFSAYDAVDGLNNIHAVNVHAGDGVPLPVSEDVMSLLRMGVELYAKTDGRLNICLGGLTSLWRDAREAGNYIPDEAAIAAAMESCDITALDLDPEAGTVALTEAGGCPGCGGYCQGLRIGQDAALCL